MEIILTDNCIAELEIRDPIPDDRYRKRSRPTKEEALEIIRQLQSLMPLFEGEDPTP